MEPLRYDLRLRLFRDQKFFGPGVAELLHGVENRRRAAAPAHDGRQVHAGGVVRRARAHLDRARLAASIH